MKFNVATLFAITAAASQFAQANPVPEPEARLIKAHHPKHPRTVDTDASDIQWKKPTTAQDLIWKQPTHDKHLDKGIIFTPHNHQDKTLTREPPSTAEELHGLMISPPPSSSTLTREPGIVRIVRRATGPSSWLECEQRWFGTAPFCRGSCPSGWTLDRYSPEADGCYDSVPTRIRTGCFGLSSNTCFTGLKALCEGNCWAAFADGRPKVRLGFAPPPRPRG